MIPPRLPYHSPATEEDTVGFWDNLKTEAKTQFIEIITWLDETNDTLVYRFPVYNQEIKMGAQLTVLSCYVYVLLASANCQALEMGCIH